VSVVNSKTRARACASRVACSAAPQKKKAPDEVPSSYRCACSARQAGRPACSDTLAGVVQGNLLDAGQEPARRFTLVEVPNFLEADRLAIAAFTQHAGITHAGEVTAGNLLNAQELRVKQHHFGVV